MARPNKQKIDTNPVQGGFNDAFAHALGGLAAGNLPAGPEAPDAPAPSRLGRVVLRRETAHRGGRTVVVVSGFGPSLDGSFLEDLARRLRKACGTGGTLHGREIEIQGEIAPRVRALLEAEGFRVAGP